jgi:hypothetical protein
MAAVEVVPPPSDLFVLRSRVAGAVLCGAAAALSLAVAATGDLLVLQSARVWLTLAGVVTAGGALSLRPMSPVSWLVAAATLAAAYAGFPDHWDSFRFLASVLVCVSLAGATLTALPVGVREVVGVTYFVFHFGGILTATTWPSPTPWITSQLGNRLYEPYLKFLYLKNAYHFYSPDPGPASHLYFLVKYRTDEVDAATGKPAERLEWVTLPTRPEQVKDPLALTYYRRLALSEHCAMATPDAFTPATFEKSEAYTRRMEVHNGLRPGYPKIPIAPPETEPWGVQYKVPAPTITTYILPSYVRHVAAHHGGPGRTVVMIRAYRLEHRIWPPGYLATGSDPYDATSYRPYFLGDYDATGTLIDPQDPMLYWLVPVLPKPGGASPGDPKKKAFDDYLEKHAGAELEWRRP